MNSGRMSFFKNSFMQYVLQIAKYVFPFITLPYLARVLGPDAYGVRAYVLSVMAIMQIFVDFGFTMSGTREMVVLKNQSHSAPCLKIGEILQAKCILGIISAILLLVAVMFIPILRENALYTFIAYSAVLATSFAPDFAFMAYEKMSILTSRYIFSRSVSLVLIFVMIHSAEDLLLIPVIDLVAAAISTIWSFIGLKTKLNLSIRLTSFSKAVHALRQSALYFISNAASTTTNAVITIFIGCFIQDNTSVAFWSLATTVLTAIESLYVPITNSLYPHMIARADTDLFKKINLLAAPVLIAGIVVLILSSSYIYLILGGDEYISGSYVLSLSAPMLFFSFYAVTFGFPLLGARGFIKEITITSVISAIVTIILLIGLVILNMFSLSAVALIRVISSIVLALPRVAFGFVKVLRKNESELVK